MNFIFSSANLYARMSLSFYEEYLEIEEQYQKESLIFQSKNQEIEYAGPVYALYALKEEKAIAAIIFQALAIEAYINLFGVVVFGENVFNSQHERKPTFQKLNVICSQLSASYPESHRVKLKELFDKRNELVHAKTKIYRVVPATMYDYDHPENNYRDVMDLYAGLSYVFVDIDAQMKLYQEFQENIRILRGAELELLEEIDKQIRENFSKQMSCNVLSMFGINNDGEAL